METTTIYICMQCGLKLTCLEAMVLHVKTVHLREDISINELSTKCYRCLFNSLEPYVVAALEKGLVRMAMIGDTPMLLGY